MKRILAVLMVATVLVAALAPAACASTKMVTTKQASLRKSASATSQALKTIPSGSTVYRLVSYATNGYYKVSYKGVVGYVLTSCLSSGSSGSSGGSGGSAGSGGGRPGGGFRPGGMPRAKLTLSSSKLTLSLTDNPVQLTANVSTPTVPGASSGDGGNTEGDGEKTQSDTFVWTSTDPTVASVVDGLITPTGVGSCKVKCIVMTDSGKLTATCKVTVKAVPPKSVILNAASVTLTVGESFQLVAQVGPDTATNKAVSWKSSKKKIASVSSGGLITAQKAGTAKITCTAKGAKKVKAICQVTVVSSTSSDGDTQA